MMLQQPALAPSPAVLVDLSLLQSVSGSVSEKLLNVMVSVGLLSGINPQPPSGESLLSVLVSHRLLLALDQAFIICRGDCPVAAKQHGMQVDGRMKYLPVCTDKLGGGRKRGVMLINTPSAWCAKCPS